MRRLSTILVWTTVVTTLHSQTRVGETAPTLSLHRVVQGEHQLPKPGHAVLIEFWATWCGPCIESMPRLNSLAEQFRTRNIDFLWLSAEPLEKIKPFLARHPMKGTVALDRDGALWRAFGGNGLPTTVLIDSSGKVAAITRAEFVNATVLTALSEQKTLPLKPLEIDNRLVNHTSLTEEKLSDSDAGTRVVVRRVNEAGHSIVSSGQIDAKGSTLKDLLADAYGVSPNLIDIPTYLNQIYAVQAWVPYGRPETLGPLMQAALSSAAGVHVFHERRTAHVLVLSGLSGHLRSVPNSRLEEGGSPTPGTMEWKAASAETIRSSIERAAGQPVVLDRPISGKFMFVLKWDSSKPASLKEALEQQGLTLIPQIKTVPTLVIESLENKPKPQ
ncbi:TIGR03435 family protein [Granulicella sp. dw_53]|uniref:TIGR03435 family protein n=1 Tax=Granulicella sp. dw_53 TaxID=2719792 RepID=UPI00210469BF|nr:TIGR03435 family protein [Granulicella sp. dw_53]